MSNDSPFQFATQEDEHPFKEPWQAHAFAIAVSLHEKGVFTWKEWTQTLGALFAEAGEDDDPENYYRHWMKAVEILVDRKSVSSTQELKTRRNQWDRAAKATPHGTPITLDADPLAKSG